MGDVYYSDEWVTLYHGDCLKITDWQAADVLITDPPYGMAFRSNQGKVKHDRIAGDSDVTARDTVLERWGDFRPWLMFGTWRLPRPQGTAQVLIWYKEGAGPGMGDLASQFGTSHEEIYLGGEWPKRTTRRGSVIRTSESPSALTTATGHPTPKPEALMNVLISASSGTIADPFAGSGSTLVAAKALGRKAIGVEVEEKYCKIIASRLAQDVIDFGETS